MTKDEANRLKPGDRVVFVHHDDECSFTTGKFYTVGGKYFGESSFHEGSVDVEADDQGVPNGWMASYFELVGGPW